MSSVTNPDWWAYHKVWVGNFQRLVLPMPVLAWLSGKPLRRRVVVASLPILQIALQYVLVHRALDGRLPIGVGLHAVNAALMLLVAIALSSVDLTIRSRVAIGISDRESSRSRFLKLTMCCLTHFELQVCANPISFAMAADDKNNAGQETYRTRS
jgi:hypothetical protein